VLQWDLVAGQFIGIGTDPMLSLIDLFPYDAFGSGPTARPAVEQTQEVLDGSMRNCWSTSMSAPVSLLDNELTKTRQSGNG
jgi:hypothetical protein